MIKQDDKLSDIFKEVGNRHDISEQQLKEMYDFFFKNLKELTQLPTLPDVVVLKFGTFKPDLKKINAKIRMYIKRYHSGYLSYEGAKMRISELWPIRQELTIDLNNRKKNDKRYGKRNRSTIADTVAKGATGRQDEA